MNGQTVIRHLTHRYYATVILFSYVLIVCKWTAFFFSKEMKSLILHRIEKGRLYYELNNLTTIKNRYINVKICPSKHYILIKETIEIFSLLLSFFYINYTQIILQQYTQIYVYRYRHLSYLNSIILSRQIFSLRYYYLIYSIKYYLIKCFAILFLFSLICLIYHKHGG